MVREGRWSLHGCLGDARDPLQQSRAAHWRGDPHCSSWLDPEKDPAPRWVSEPHSQQEPGIETRAGLCSSLTCAGTGDAELGKEGTVPLPCLALEPWPRQTCLVLAPGTARVPCACREGSHSQGKMLGAGNGDSPLTTGAARRLWLGFSGRDGSVHACCMYPCISPSAALCGEGSGMARADLVPENRLSVPWVAGLEGRGWLQDVTPCVGCFHRALLPFSIGICQEKEMETQGKGSPTGKMTAMARSL